MEQPSPIPPQEPGFKVNFIKIPIEIPELPGWPNPELWIPAPIIRQQSGNSCPNIDIVSKTK